MFTIKRTAEFDAWIFGLRDTMTRIRLAKRLDKVQRGLLGDTKPVGDGVHELREDFGPGWRMYYVQRGGVFIVMLGGGDKSTQDSDIARAQSIAQELRHEQDQDPAI